jgi:mannosyltransferase OCH1-like enzyme
MVLFNKIYEKNILNLNNLSNTTYLIPKKIHQVWIGPSPLPEKFKWMMKTWQEKHPDWEYKLWTNEDLESFNLENKVVYDQFTNWGAKSDIFKYEIVYRHGGVYIDIDFECIKPLDTFNKSYNFYSSFIFGSEEIGAALIAAIPGHPILKQIINKIKDINNITSDFTEILKTTGPIFFTRNIFEYLANNINDDKIMIFPSIYFYPFPATSRYKFWAEQINREQILSYVKPETYGIHYWATSWQ